MAGERPSDRLGNRNGDRERSDSPPRRECGSREEPSRFLTDSRAQTINDFAIGIGVFLLATSFVFVFVPDLLSPFNKVGESGDNIRVERAADTLVSETMGGDPTSQATTVLSPSGVQTFFTDCDSNPSQDYMRSKLGLKETDTVRVVFQKPDGSTASASDVDALSIDPVCGGEATDKSISTWVRIVKVKGQVFRLVVKIA